MNMTYLVTKTDRRENAGTKHRKLADNSDFIKTGRHTFHLQQFLLRFLRLLLWTPEFLPEIVTDLILVTDT